MKIDIGQAPGLDPTGGRSAAPVREAEREARTGGVPEGAGDRVEVSGSARALAALASEVGDVEGVDRRRVEEVRRALENGVFPPSPERIAAGLLRTLGAGSG